MLVSGLLVAHLLHNKLYKGLNKYPGHPLAAYTNWWRFWDVSQRHPEVTHMNLHKKHGDIVRLGPNVLSFADPKAIKTIYGLNKGMTKVRTRFLICSKVHVSHMMLTCTHSQPSTPFNRPWPKASVCSLCSALDGRTTMPSLVAALTVPLQCRLSSDTSHSLIAQPTSTLSGPRNCSLALTVSNVISPDGYNTTHSM